MISTHGLINKDWVLKNLVQLGCLLQKALSLIIYNAGIAHFKVTNSKHLSQDCRGPLIELLYFPKQARSFLKKNKGSALEFR